MSELAHRRGINDWPTHEQLDSLCRRASGFFPFAVATVNFVDNRFLLASRQLDAIMQSPESTAYEGKAEVRGTTGFDSLYMGGATLDSFYMSILQESFDGIEIGRAHV